MADSSKDIQLRELKDMITELKNLIKTVSASKHGVVTILHTIDIL